MRRYDRRFIQRMTHTDRVLALMPNPLTRVELPSAPPVGPGPQTRPPGTPAPGPTGGPPPGAGPRPAR